jgi:hypothetical protein
MGCGCDRGRKERAYQCLSVEIRKCGVADELVVSHSELRVLLGCRISTRIQGSDAPVALGMRTSCVPELAERCFASCYAIVRHMVPDKYVVLPGLSISFIPIFVSCLSSLGTCAVSYRRRYTGHSSA